MAHVDLTRSPGRFLDGLHAAWTLVRFAADVLRAGEPLRGRGAW